MAQVAKAVVTAAVSFALTGNPFSAALAFVATLASSFLAPKPKSPSTPDFNSQARDRQQIVRSPTAARRLVIGTTALSGPLLFASSTGASKQYLHLVLAIAGHEVAGALDFQLNDEIAGARDADGNVTAGRFSGYARLRLLTGADSQAADADLVAECSEWSTAHRLRGVAYIYARLNWSQDVFPNGIPNVKAIVKGAKLYDPRTDATGWSDNWALAVRHVLVALFGCDDDELDDDTFIAAANTSDEMVALVPAAKTFTADAATDRATLADTALYIATGDGVQLSTTGALPAGLAAATTYYWIETSQGVGQFAASLANARAGTAIDLGDAGTGTHTVTRVSQPRYTAAGAIELDQVPLEAIEGLLTAGAGRLVYTQGKFRLFAGVATTAEHEIDATWLRGGAEVELLPRPSRQDLFNAARGTFVDPARFWQPGDFAPVTSTAYETEDGDERIFRDMALEWTHDQARAQRLATLFLNRHRVGGETVNLPCTWTALQVSVGDGVALTLAPAGAGSEVYDAALFVVTGWSLARDGLGIDLTLEREDPSVYDWTAGQATAYAAAPSTNLFLPYDVAAPTALALFNDPYTATGGAVIQRIRAEWTAAADAFVVAYEVDYKLHADSAWSAAGAVVASPAQVLPVDLGGSYDVRVRSLRGNGARSAYATVTSFTVTGDTTPPAPPTAVAATGKTAGIELGWTNPADGDFDHVDVYRNTVNDSGTATKIAEATGVTFFDPQSAGSGRYYWLKAVDTSNNASAFNTVAGSPDTDGVFAIAL